MKKRYARILAATLSAAMVFTSAPVNFTGIDLGVIEAKAATSTLWTSDLLQEKLEAAVGTVTEDGDNLVAFDGTETMTTVATTVNAAVLAALEADNDCGHTELTTEIDVSSESWKSDVTVGTHTVKVTATCTHAGCIGANDPIGNTTEPTAETTITYGIKPAGTTEAITADEFKTIIEGIKYNSTYTPTTKQNAFAGTAITAANTSWSDYADALTQAAGAPYNATDVTVGKYTIPATAQLNATNYSPAGEGWTVTSGTNITINTGLTITVDPVAVNNKYKTEFPATIEYTYDKANAEDVSFVVTQITKQLKANGDVLHADNTDFTMPSGLLKYDTNWTAKAQDVVKVAKATPETTGLTITFSQTFDDGDVTDYSELNPVYDDNTKKTGKIEKTVNVKIVKSTGSLEALKQLVTDGDVEAIYTIGDAAVKLDGTAKDKFTIVAAPDVSVLKKNTTKKVTIESVDKYPSSVYDVQKWLKNNPEWNYSNEKLSTEIDIDVTPKTLKATDVVWPTKLAEGETITIGDKIADIKLEKTDSCKYGKFYLASKVSRLTAAADDTKYTLVFEPDADYAKVANLNASNDGDVTNTGTTYTKDFAVKVSKKVVKSADIKVSLANVEANDLVYGFEFSDTDDAPYEDALLDKVLASTATYDNEEEAGTWSIKDHVANEIIPIGKNTVTFVYTLKNKTDYAIDGEKASFEVPVEVTIEKTVYEAQIDAPQSVKVGANAGLDAWPGWKDGMYVTPATLDIPYDTAPADLGDFESISYQWYSKSKGKLYGAQDPGLKLDTSVMVTDTYWCEITLKVNKNATKVKKDAWAAIIGDGVLKTEEKKVSVTNMTIDRFDVIGTLEYGKIDAQATVRALVNDDYELKSVTWKVVSKADKSSVAVDGKLSAAGVATATIPTTLKAGDYLAVATITATSSKYATDVVEYEIPFTVDRTDLDFDFTKITFNKDAKIIKYGQKLSEIKFNPAKDAEKYGTYEYISDVCLPVGVQAAPEDFVKFIPNADAKANYTNFDADGGFTGKVQIDGVEVQKGELVIKAEDLVVTVGDIVTDTMTSAKAEGLVGADTLKNLEISVETKLASTVSTAKAGTIADVITVTAKKDGKENEKIELDNYKVKVVPGSVIVKAATAPSVKPTPAPVKQATVAAPKAAKAKSTVKVGKKYTLKLKYASATAKKNVKKVTWKSSKKSVATVSSKGKVTAVKAGKATIAATITFKDGSKKKVKFTVTVK